MITKNNDDFHVDKKVIKIRSLLKKIGGRGGGWGRGGELDKKWVWHSGKGTLQLDVFQKWIDVINWLASDANSGKLEVTSIIFG